MFMKVTTSFDRRRKSSSVYKNNKKTKIGIQNNYENNKHIHRIYK
jgi:hypothetical protein